MELGHSSCVGSGVIYRSGGIILTNDHVVAGAASVEVGFADGSRVPGRVIATDPDGMWAWIEMATFCAVLHDTFRVVRFSSGDA